MKHVSALNPGIERKIDEAGYHFPVPCSSRHLGLHVDRYSRPFFQSANADSRAEPFSGHASGSKHSGDNFHRVAKPDRADQTSHAYGYATRANGDPFN
jgi:hypothetical protein